MSTRKIYIISGLLVVISFGLGIAFYPFLPAQIATHWGADGNVNGYSGKLTGAFIIPFVSIFVYLIFIAIPKIDPLKANIKEFRKYYDLFIVIMLIFLTYLQLLILLFNAGVHFEFVRFIFPALGLLLFYLGILVEHSKRNWFIGIRTPWTISNEEVWNKTHSIGGKLFKISGIFALLGAFFYSYAIYFILIPVIATSIFTVIYSYIEFQRLEHH